MDTSRSNSGASRRTQESLPVFKLWPSTITKDSKAQLILGLSRTELQTAKTQSLKSKGSFSSNRTSLAENPPRSKIVGVAVDEAELHSNPDTQHDEFDRFSDVGSWSRRTSLKKQPSTSTLRSLYETATSSTRDLVTTKGNPEMSLTRNSDMEQSKQFRFFRSSKLRSIKETKPAISRGQLPGIQTNFVTPSRPSGMTYPTIKSPVVTDVSVVRRPSATCDIPQTGKPQLQTNQKYRGAEHLFHEKRNDGSIPRPTINTPYAKINVRRPKAGTTDWFDDLEGVTSDEEDAPEPEFTPRFIVNDHGSFQSIRNSAQSPIEHEHEQQHELRSAQTQIATIPELPTEASKSLRKHSAASDVERRGSQQSSSSQPKPNPLAIADLQQESILHLSEGEDDHENENEDRTESKDETKDILLPLQPVQSSEFRPSIRHSLTLETCEESDIEIGLAHTAESMARLPGNRPSPIKLVDAKGSHTACSSPTTKSPRVTSDASGNSPDSILDKNVDEKDADEDALLSSFPATPTSVHMPRRTSARSSASFSDDRSIVSMKMMPVTRQEENLISAMRMKRAAMKRAEKAAARNNTVKTPEHSDKIVVSTKRTKSIGRSARLSELAMLQYGPPLKISTFGLPDKDISQFRSVLTDSYGSRGSTAPLLSRYLAETQLHELPASPSGRQMSSISRTPSMRRSFDTFPRPRSSQSTTSCDSPRRNSNMIVLDNLNTGLTTQTFPSHLCMESPFVTWERTDSAAAVH